MSSWGTPARWTAAAALGAAIGAGIGLAIVATVDPNGAYTNADYRSGADTGYVLRYAALGLGAAVLLLWRPRRSVATLRVLALVAVLGVAVLPPALHSKTASEQRRAKATAIEDPRARGDAVAVAGAVDGCVSSTRRELAATSRQDDLDVEVYCECLIAEITAGPKDDEQQLSALAAAVQGGKPPRVLTEAVESCGPRAAR